MAKAPIFGQDRLGIWGISDVMHSMPAQGSTTHLFGHVTKPMCTHIFCKRSGHTTPCKDHTTASSTTHNHNRLGLVPFSLPPRIVFDSLPRLAIGLVELLLNLLHTVAAGHQHPGDDEGIGLLPAGLELLPGLFSGQLPGQLLCREFLFHLLLLLLLLLLLVVVQQLLLVVVVHLLLLLVLLLLLLWMLMLLLRLLLLRMMHRHHL